MPQKFRHYGRGVALVASDNPKAASMDRKVLRDLMFRGVKLYSSGQQAIQYLRGYRVCFVFVDARLDDMDGYSFIKKVREEELAKDAPLVMVTSDNRRKSVLAAISSGCNGYIIRPYSMETFERHIMAAMKSYGYNDAAVAKMAAAKKSVEQGEYDKAIASYSDVVDMENQAQKFFDLGAKKLMAKRFDEAIIAFNKALKYNKLYGEAYKGMADAFKGKGDGDKAQAFMKKAATVFAAQNRMEETRELFVEIVKNDPNAVNPFNTIGMQYRKKGDYESALDAYFQGQKISPDDEHLLYNIANAYLYLKDREGAVRYLDEALRINAGFEQAAKLYKMLTKREWTPPSDIKLGGHESLLAVDE